MVKVWKIWKKPGKAEHPKKPPGKRSTLDRLNGASSIVVALTAVAALVVSLVTLHMQSQDRASALQDRAAAARKAQTAFADRVVTWWTASANGLSVYVHIQNDNALPVEIWIVYLRSDGEFGPESPPILKLSSAYSPTGGTGGIIPLPHVFIGQVPPCTGIEVHAPFATLDQSSGSLYPKLESPYPLSQVEGDITFADSSGSIWAKSPSGILRRIQYASLSGGVVVNDNVMIASIIATGSTGGGYRIVWANNSRSPICG